MFYVDKMCSIKEIVRVEKKLVHIYLAVVGKDDFVGVGENTR